MDLRFRSFSSSSLCRFRSSHLCRASSTWLSLTRFLIFVSFKRFAKRRCRSCHRFVANRCFRFSSLIRFRTDNNLRLCTILSTNTLGSPDESPTSTSFVSNSGSVSEVSFGVRVATGIEKGETRGLSTGMDRT